ncbi:MAG: glycoside hydrolase family 3 C-terminal domain-containing protein [Bacteroidales bacterium]|nr:glycoside hydrolase family 3 C-terminal domain-containing protein [Bacteroidales bacterium]
MNMHRTYFSLCLIALITIVSCTSDKKPAYLNTKLSYEKRAEDLVSKMTLEEKVSQLTYTAEAIERLGVPEYNWWNECLHGVARSGKATVFPQAIGLAATWDRDMIAEMAEATSTEARAKYNDFQSKGKRGIYQGLTFWSPNINIFRDPRWGRGMETYGEDPYLTGEIGTTFIKGLQGSNPDYLKVVATSKHYAVHSGPEPLRHSFNAVVSQRDFRDTYFPAFKQTIVDGKAYSVMCAYNAYMGEPCCGSDALLQELLRNELGFEGYVVSDCWAIKDFWDGHGIVETAAEASAIAVLSGTDVNCGFAFDSLVSAVKQGYIAEADLDIAVTRLMKARMKLGMFDPPENDPWSDLGADHVATAKHRRTALETTRKSMVLLKNENNALPLRKDLKKIAVIGPNAEDVEVMCGNYNGTPFEPVTPLQGIIDKAENFAEIKYARGCAHAEGLPFLEVIPGDFLYTSESLESHGLNAAYYNNKKAEGNPIYEGVDGNVDFYWWDTSPRQDMEDDNYSVKWTGYIVPDKTGTYALGCEAKYFRLELDGKRVSSNSNIHHPNKRYSNVDLKAGKPYKIEVMMWDEHGDALCHLMWAPPEGNIQKKALEIASWADQVIMFMGLSPRLEGEEMKVEVEGFAGGDRTSLDLPEVQMDLMRKVVATGKPVVLVLLNGSAVAVNWADENIPAILEAWYPGEAAGTAIADVLFGDYNPAGRLPVTFYKSVNDLPPFENYDMEGRTYRYYKGEVLYPFGYGLSYSEFTYNNLRTSSSEIKPGGSVKVSVDVSNNSERDGEEVVQFYIHETNAPDARPLIDLRGFERIMIKAGETKTVSVELTKKELAYYNFEKETYAMNPGTIELFAGPSSDRKKLLKTEVLVK